MSRLQTVIALLIAMGGFLLWEETVAQDIHFSQFYSSPLTLNPALTGGMEGKYRVSANFRNQWSALTPYTTYSLGYDMSILNNVVKKDIAAVGLVAVNDKVKGNGIQNMQLMATAAYHKGLGKKNNHYLAAGFQGGGVQKSINTADVLFPDQWSPSTGASSSITSQDAFQNSSTLLFDFQAGLLWYSFIGENSNVFAGASVFHISNPSYSFLGNAQEISRRYMVHGGGKFALSNKLNIVPNVLAMQQNKVRQINAGTSLEFSFPKANGVFTIGGWYRFQDAAIIATSFQYKTYKIGVSYDFTISSVSEAMTSQLGSYEISLVLNFESGQDIDVDTHPGPKI